MLQNTNYTFMAVIHTGFLDAQNSWKSVQSSKKIVDNIKVIERFIEGFMFQYIIWQTKTWINLAYKYSYKMASKVFF